MQTHFCRCGNRVAATAREGGLVIKSRAVLYNVETGAATAICDRCKTEVPIRRSIPHVRLVIERKTL